MFDKEALEKLPFVINKVGRDNEESDFTSNKYQQSKTKMAHESIVLNNCSSKPETTWKFN